jgi:mRNA interferase HigB
VEFAVRVISHKRLKDFWDDPKSPAGSERYLAAWYKLVLDKAWRNFADLRGTFSSADAVGDCVVFDVGNNRIRLIGRVRYATDKLPGVVYVLAVLTHAEYDENKWPDDCGCHEPPPKPKTKSLRPGKKPKGSK